MIEECDWQGICDWLNGYRTAFSGDPTLLKKVDTLQTMMAPISTRKLSETEAKDVQMLHHELAEQWDLVPH